MKLHILLGGITLLALSGCTNPILSPQVPAPVCKPAPKVTPPALKKIPYAKASEEKQNRFHEDMIAVATSTKQDPHYHRMALDTPERKAWFKNLMYQLWDGQITKSQFIAEGVRKYPTHQHEFEFVANGFEKRR